MQATLDPADAPRGSPADALPAWTLVLAGTITVQFGAAFARTLFDGVGAAGVSVLRLGFSALVLVVVWRPRLGDYDARRLRLAGAFGLALGCMNTAFYEGLARVPLGIAVTIEFVGPLAVAVVGSHKRVDLLWAALAAGGIVLLADPGGGRVDALGVAFVLAAGGCWAAYILLAQRAGAAFTGGRGLAVASVVAALVPIAPAAVDGHGGDLLSPGILAGGFAVAMLCSAIPYSLEMVALRRMAAYVFGVLMSLEPAVAALAGFVILGQGLRAVDVVAIGCVVVASIGVTRGAARLVT